MRKSCKRRPYQPKAGFDSVLVDAITAANREDIEAADLDILITPSLAQIDAIDRFGTITVEGFVLLNEANCTIYCLARLLWQGARCDATVKIELHRICQEAVTKAEEASEGMALMAERFKQDKELRATADEMEKIKASIHMMETLRPLANRGALFAAMREAKGMIEKAAA